MATKQSHQLRFRLLVPIALSAALGVSGCSGGDDDVAVEEPADPQEVVTIGGSMPSPGLISDVDPTQVSGAEVDVATNVTERMTTTPPDAQLHWVPTTADSVADDITSGELDLALGQFSGDEVSDEIAWVGPYATVEAAVLVHQPLPEDTEEPADVLVPDSLESLEDFADASVCVVTGSIAAGTELPVDDSTVEPTVSECEIGMRSGRYDAVAADDLQLAGLLTEPAMAGRYELLLWSDLADDEEDIDVDEELLETAQYWIAVHSTYCADAAAALKAAVDEGSVEEAFASLEQVEGWEPQQPVAPGDITAEHCDSDA